MERRQTGEFEIVNCEPQLIAISKGDDTIPFVFSF